MDVLVILVVTAISLIIMWKVFRFRTPQTNDKGIATSSLALKCTIQGLVFIISQSLLSIFLMNIKCTSFITIIFHFSIPAVGAIAAIVLQNKSASMRKN